MPPRRLKYQNTLGMMTGRARSDAIHWTKKRDPNVSWPRKPITYQSATCESRSWFMGHPPDLVTEHSRLEPANSKEVANPPKEAVPHPVLRDAVTPGPMPDRHLGDPGSLKLAEGRQEAVRADEERDPFQRFAPVCLERAAHVPDRIPDHRAPDRVRHARGDTAPPGVGPRRPDPGDDVGALEGVQQRGDAGWIVLSVRVQRHDHVPPGVLQPRGQRAALPDI